jgi:putative hydrolase of the HAD superfamily
MGERVLYFDLGNVLLGFCHDRMCRQMAQVAGKPFEVVYETLFARWSPDCAQWQIEDGRMSADDYYAYFCEQTKSRPDRALLEHAAGDIFWPLDESICLLRDLHAAGNRIGLLSNINPVHWSFVSQGQYPWLQRPTHSGSLFDYMVLSYEAKSMKPDPRIYEHAAQLAGVNADQLFFVDDREDNVAGALAAGIDAVQFIDAQRLRAELQSRGVAGA